MLIYQLLRPFAYLSIDHSAKWKFDWMVPFFLSFVCMLILYPAGHRIDYFGVDGLINRLTSFVQILPGFYVAALAAIATFNRVDIDQHMPDPAPTIKITLQTGQKNEIPLTRRRFLCLMFAFLAAESFVILVLAIFSSAIGPFMKELVVGSLATFTKFSFVFFILFLFWQLVTITFMGLYYLGDRLHQPDV